MEEELGALVEITLVHGAFAGLDMYLLMIFESSPRMKYPIALRALAFDGRMLVVLVRHQLRPFRKDRVAMITIMRFVYFLVPFQITASNVALFALGALVRIEACMRYYMQPKVEFSMEFLCTIIAFVVRDLCFGVNSLVMLQHLCL